MTDEEYAAYLASPEHREAVEVQNQHKIDRAVTKAREETQVKMFCIFGAILLLIAVLGV